MLRGSISFAEGLDSLKDLPVSSAKLPFETSTASAWADPMARAVVAHAGDQVLTAVLQYRHDTPANGGKPWKPGAVATLKPNNICRVELNERGGAVDRLASVACGQRGEGLQGIQSLAFGDFAIGMNSNLYHSGVWRVPKGFIGRSGVELISGKHMAALPATLKLPPNVTAVVFTGSTSIRSSEAFKSDDVPVRSGPVRVACVGDSITAGYLASNKSMAYPGRLQAQLTARFGEGSYIVSNFGAGGATVQRDADSPYWNRTQFAQWVNGTYDVVIMMLGTNDAKMPDAECIARWGATRMCAANWPAACSEPHPTASSCAVVKDYLSLIELAGTLGSGGRKPLMAIMKPPPLWKDGAYGMKQSVLNDVMPKLVPQIAKEAGLPPPIDIYTALGGTSDWRSTYPACGCQRPQGANAVPIPERSSAAPNYTATHGYMAVGEVLSEEQMSWTEATAACSAKPDCAGITFKSNESQPAGATEIRLKQCPGVTNNPKVGWWSWTKPADSLPVPSMPATCRLFCQNGQSCDPCHPDDDGYDLVATQVFEWIVKHTV